MFSSEKKILCGGESTIIVTCALLSQSVFFLFNEVFPTYSSSAVVCNRYICHVPTPVETLRLARVLPF